MKKCSNTDHPHCTFWVMPGEDACAGGHGQPAAAAPSSYDLLSAQRLARSASAGTAHPAAHSPAHSPDAAARSAGLYDTTSGSAASVLRPRARPQLHISGFDPRAAGGRQTLKMELRGMPDDCAPQLAIALQSDLLPNGALRQQFVRATDGGWRPVYVEFSSRGKEHGQYQIAAELTSRHTGLPNRQWECTFVILVPRLDATLTEIHRIFLSTHKNVRVMADDASIARVSAQGGDSMDIDVTARNAGIAHVNLDAPQGKVDLGFSTIAWDEDLIEIDAPSATVHPHLSRAACLVNAAPEAGAQRQIRLFAMEECVLGRFELVDPEADVLLTHFGQDGQDASGLTRRLSGRHAVIRRAAQGGFEIEDVSRYGVLLDGVWPGKHKPVALRLGMRIELSASIKGIVVLSVSAIMPHGVILHRLDGGAHAECFYLLAPDSHPGYPMKAFAAAPNAAALPLLLHHDGGFWHLDQLTGKETALTPSTPLDKLSRVPKHSRYASDPYPESWIIRTGAHADHDTVTAPALQTV